MEGSLEDVLDRAQSAIQRAKNLTQRWSEGSSLLARCHLPPSCSDAQTSIQEEAVHAFQDELGASSGSLPHPHLPHTSRATASSLLPPPTDAALELHPPLHSNSLSSRDTATSVSYSLPNWLDRLRAERLGLVGLHTYPGPQHSNSLEQASSSPTATSLFAPSSRNGTGRGEVGLEDIEGSADERVPDCLLAGQWHTNGDGQQARAHHGSSGGQQHAGGADQQYVAHGRQQHSEDAFGSSSGSGEVGREREPNLAQQLAAHGSQQQLENELGSGSGGGGGERDWRPNMAQPFLQVAHQLASLQQQQSNTLKQLLCLRLKQLRLRQQQLASLHELLQAEYDAVQGTPLQVSAVQQALQLLSQSLEDMDLAAMAITASRTLDDVGSVAHTVARADARAEDTARMARQLLGVLREFPRRMEDLLQNVMIEAPAPSRGASDIEVAQVPVITCTPSHPSLGDPCPICLSEFRPGDNLKCLDCCHFYHGSCMDQWLRIKANCPLCMHPLRQGEQASAQQQHQQQQDELQWRAFNERPSLAGDDQDQGMHELPSSSWSALRLGLFGHRTHAAPRTQAAARAEPRAAATTTLQAVLPTAAPALAGNERRSEGDTAASVVDDELDGAGPCQGRSAAGSDHSVAQAIERERDVRSVIDVSSSIGASRLEVARMEAREAANALTAGRGSAAQSFVERLYSLRHSLSRHRPSFASTSSASNSRGFQGNGEDVLSLNQPDEEGEPHLQRDGGRMLHATSDLRQQWPASRSLGNMRRTEGDEILCLDGDGHEHAAHQSEVEGPSASANATAVIDDVDDASESLSSAIQRASAFLSRHYG